MGDLTLNPNLVAKSFDANKNGVVSDDLKVHPEAMERIDANKDGKVSVEELASGIGNDRVVVKDGQVKPAKGSLNIPNLFKDVENCNAMARNTLSRTDAFWNTSEPLYPNKDNFYYTDANGKQKFDKTGYNTAKDNYYRQLADYKQDLVLDRALLVNTLQNMIQTTDDGNVQRIARNALDNQQWRDITNMFGNITGEGQSYKRQYETDRMLLRNAVYNIASITEFTQPSETVKKANQQVNSALNAVVNEQNTIDSKLKENIDKANKKIEEINNGWMPFKGMRTKSVENKIGEAKAFSTQGSMQQVENLAKQAYEAGVQATNWDSVDDARNIAHKTQGINNEAYNVQEKAKAEIKKIEKLGK